MTQFNRILLLTVAGIISISSYAETMYIFKDSNGQTLLTNTDQPSGKFDNFDTQIDKKYYIARDEEPKKDYHTEESASDYDPSSSQEDTSTASNTRTNDTSDTKNTRKYNYSTPKNKYKYKAKAKPKPRYKPKYRSNQNYNSKNNYKNYNSYNNRSYNYGNSRGYKSYGKYKSYSNSKRSRYDHLIRSSARRYGVDPALVKAIIHTESNFKPRARSHVGAQGLMQLMPGTARELRVRNPWSPSQNIDGGTKYIAKLLRRFNNNPRLALAGYNAGPNRSSLRAGRIPNIRETKNYVRKVMSRYNNIYRNDPNLSSGGGYYNTSRYSNRRSRNGIKRVSYGTNKNYISNGRYKKTF